MDDFASYLIIGFVAGIIYFVAKRKIGKKMGKKK